MSRVVAARDARARGEAPRLVVSVRARRGDSGFEGRET